jgi:hypothetical protein
MVKVTDLESGGRAEGLNEVWGGNIQRTNKQRLIPETSESC